jgi:hypothetical protein
MFDPVKFESIEVFKRVGGKFFAWHDVMWFRRQLRASRQKRVMFHGPSPDRQR